MKFQRKWPHHFGGEVQIFEIQKSLETVTTSVCSTLEYFNYVEFQLKWPHHFRGYVFQKSSKSDFSIMGYHDSMFRGAIFWDRKELRDCYYISLQYPGVLQFCRVSAKMVTQLSRTCILKIANLALNPSCVMGDHTFWPFRNDSRISNFRCFC